MTLADRSQDAFQRMGKRTTLADTLHQAGRLDEAGPAFAEAEAMQEALQPEYTLLYSLQGYRYCDLLLGQGEARAVLDRAGQTLDWVSRANQDILSAALDHLSLGRAALVLAEQAGTGDFTQARAELDTAVDGLRQAGRQDILPRGLLARAALFRAMGAYPQAHTDLNEALAIAEQGGMGLHEADAHLEHARLCLAEGDREGGVVHFEIAEEMVNRMKYGRRFGEVAELRGVIGGDK